jgi:hypothetical protein
LAPADSARLEALMSDTVLALAGPLGEPLTRVIRAGGKKLRPALTLTNGVLTGLRIVSYSPASILGLRVAYAPVEDLAFGFALITITLCCWARLAAEPTTAGGSAASGPS